MQRLIQADGPVLAQILDDTFPLWGEGLSRRGYEQWNSAQHHTAWGERNLSRLALLDGDRLLASAKRYDVTLRVDGTAVKTLGIGAVFTPKAQRGHGYARAMIAELEDAARRDGARMALLFSEIGSAFYQRLGYVAVPVKTLDLAVADLKGAPAMLVRSGEDRDAEAVAAMQAARAATFRIALLPDAAQIVYSVVKKRLFVGLHPNRRRRIEYFVAEEGHQAVAYVLLYISSETPGAPEVWSLEACGDRDPTGARIGAMLQVLIARNPAVRPAVIRGWWPPLLEPPQLSLSNRPPAGEVMMVKPLVSDVRLRKLSPRDVMYWHGDAF